MAGCVALHVVAAAAAHSPSGVHALVLLGMAFACVPCATHVLLAPTRATWIRSGLVSAGMLVVHPLLDTSHAGHGDVAVPVVAVGMVVGPVTAMCLACTGAATDGWRGAAGA